MLTQVRRVGQHAALYALIRQELLSDLLESNSAGGRFDLDIRSHEIRFSDAVHGRCQLVASIAVTPPSLLWGWAPMFAENVGPDPAAALVRDFGQLHNLSQLTTEENVYEVPRGREQLDAITDLSHDVGMLAVEVFGPDVVYYSFPTGGSGSRMVVVVDQLSVPVPRLSLSDAFVKLPRLLQQVDDVEWSLQGLANLAGWHLDRNGAQGYRMADASGAWFGLDVSRDQQGRISNVHFQGINQP